MTVAVSSSVYGWGRVPVFVPVLRVVVFVGAMPVPMLCLCLELWLPVWLCFGFVSVYLSGFVSGLCLVLYFGLGLTRGRVGVGCLFVSVLRVCTFLRSCFCMCYVCV